MPGDAYLIVAGCPVKAANHALKICDMAFDMMDGITMLKVDTCQRSQNFRNGRKGLLLVES